MRYPIATQQVERLVVECKRASDLERENEELRLAQSHNVLCVVLWGGAL